jgi:hypothetical protein
VLLFAPACLLRLEDETYVVRSLDYPACEGRSAESWPAREQFRHVLGDCVRKMVEQGEVPILYDSADDLAPILSSLGRTQIAAPDRHPSSYDIWLIVPVSPLGETAERLAAMRVAQVRPEGMASQDVGPERYLPAELVTIDKPAASPIMSSVEVDQVTTRDTSAPPTIEFQRASASVSGACQTYDPEQLTPRIPNSLVSEGFAHARADAPEQPSSSESVFIDKPAASPIMSSVEVDYVTTRDTSAPPTIEFQRASEFVSSGGQTDDPEQPGTPKSLVSEGFAHARADAPEQPSSSESVFIDKPAAPNQSSVEADEANTPQKPEPLFSVRYLPTGSVASPETTSRLRGIGLFAAIFDELSNQLGKEFSAAELMQAAQRLIDVSKAEYIPNPYKDVAERAGYYSWDLVRAFGSDNPWRIAGIETSRLDHCDVDEFSSEESHNAKLILEGWNERNWEF